MADEGARRAKGLKLKGSATFETADRECTIRLSATIRHLRFALLYVRAYIFILASAGMNDASER